VTLGMANEPHLDGGKLANGAGEEPLGGRGQSWDGVGQAELSGGTEGLVGRRGLTAGAGAGTGTPGQGARACPLEG